MLVVVAVVLVGSTILGGCGSADHNTEIVDFWAIGREGEAVGELLEDFNQKHPDIDVRVHQIPWNAAHEKLLTAYVGNATPDLAQIGNTWLAQLKSLGALATLDARIAGSAIVREADYFPGIWSTNEMAGAIYGIPWYIDTRLLFYRQDMLAYVGFDCPPTNWEEWKTVLQRLKRSFPDQYPLFLPTDEWQPQVLLALQQGATMIDSQAQKADFQNEAFREAFGFYVSLFREGYAPTRGYQQVTNLYQDLEDGNFAMFITGPWNIVELNRRMPAHLLDQWAAAPMPGPRGTGSSLAGGSSLVLFEKSDVQDAAWKVAEFLSRPEEMVRLHEALGSLPARKSAWEQSNLHQHELARAFWQQMDQLEPVPQLPEWEEIAARIMRHAEAAAWGRVTTEEALRQLDEDANRILNRRGATPQPDHSEQAMATR